MKLTEIKNKTNFNHQTWIFVENKICKLIRYHLNSTVTIYHMPTQISNKIYSRIEQPVDNLVNIAIYPKIRDQLNETN